MKTAISIPDPIFNSAEKFAAKAGVSRSELYVMALKRFLLENNQQEVTKKLNEIYGREDSSLDKPLQTMQFASLPVDKW